MKKYRLEAKYIQSILGLHLTRSYYVFLRDNGYHNQNGVEIYGVGGKIKKTELLENTPQLFYKESDLLKAVLDCWKDQSWNRDLVPISPDSNGFWCIDLDDYDPSTDEAPVSYYDPQTKIAIKRYETFGDFWSYIQDRTT